MHAERNDFHSSFYLNMSETNKTLWFWNNSSNSSGVLADIKSEHSVLVIVNSILLVSAVFGLLCMGCEIVIREVFYFIRRPVGIFAGMFSQFVLMPLMAFVLSRIISINKFHAAGILIISCSPGGGVSNLYTYFCDGDVSLSVTMTTMSTILAMGMMPLNVWIYGSSYQTEDLVIPYQKLALSLVSVTSPVAVGAILKWKFPRIAFFIVKIGSWLTLLIIGVVMVLEFFWFSHMFVDVSPGAWILTTILPLTGLTMGYFLAHVLGEKMKVRKAIAIECGMQNVPTAFAVTIMSFSQEEQQHIVVIPWIYGLMMILIGFPLCILHQIHKKCKACKGEKFEIPGKENGDQEISAL